MERASKVRRSKKNNKGRKSPTVPIKTYRWEDIRRARKKGGYPWTYLYKGPFNEVVDPEQFTMEALRRSKSACTMGGKSDGVDIFEISSTAESGKTTPSLLHPGYISEPDDSSAKNSLSGSVVIEEFVADEEKDLEDDVQVKEFQIESAESSDNISQYLDKDERDPGNSNTLSRTETSGEEAEKSRDQRAKSEEVGQRKRKLSAESSYSRYSLSKLGVIKKLKDVKNKLKVPKMSFPTKKLGKTKNGSPKDEKIKKETRKKSTEIIRTKKPEKPVYIHIPLKPPPGETDEFSYIEFEAKKDREDVKNEAETKENGMRDDQKKPKEDENEPKEPEGNKSESKNNLSSKKPALKINPAFKQFLKDVRKLKEKEEQGRGKEDETADIKGDKKNPNEDEDDKKDITLKAGKPEEARADKSIEESEKMDVDINKNDETEPLESETKNIQVRSDSLDTEGSSNLEEQTTEDDAPKEDEFEKLFQKQATKKENEPPATVKKDETDPTRNIRSKSEEPQGKRRSSIGSSYSRKSLSKLGIMKKLREASQKIKSSFSMTSLRRKNSKKDSTKEDQEDKHDKAKKSKLMGVPKKPVEPVYIRIPLKPPEGQTDEFSHLEFEQPSTSSAGPEPNKDRTDSLDSSSSPKSPPNNDIHFIFLTPPSDEEILDDKAADTPETPSSDDVVFFGSLKRLAQHVVDQVSPAAAKNVLETVKEESVSEKGSTGDEENVETKEDEKGTQTIKNADKKTTEETEKESNKETDSEADKGETVRPSGKMLVDVEDGLNEPSPKQEELKSVLKLEPSSPTLRKKVSFKRKSKALIKDKEKDSGYEDIQPPKGEQILQAAEEVADVPGPEDKIVSADGETPGEADAVREKNGIEEDGDRKGLVVSLSQSMSVDEEKSYLDRKIVKDTSLEEDYNKWSKISDHEYEPINPPEDVTLMRTSTVVPTVTVVDTDLDPRVAVSAKEIVEKPVEEKKKPFFHFLGLKEKVQNDSDKSQGQSGQDTVRSRSSQGRGAEKAGEQTKTDEGPNKFQTALKQKTDRFKNRTSELKNKVKKIKRPAIRMPGKANFKKPDLKKFKIEKPKINLPKIPDATTIHLPSFGLPRTKKTIEKRTVETRQFSTESNAGDSDGPKRRIFDFGTFPRFKKKKPKEKETAFATAPRAENGKERTTSESVRIPLHSLDADDALDEDELREDSQEGERSSRIRFNKEIDIDDDYERENQAINQAEYLSRWQHGNFNRREEEDRFRREEEDRFSRGEGEEEEEEEEEQIFDNRRETVGPKIVEVRFRSEEPFDDRKDEHRPYLKEEEAFERRMMRNKEMITDLDDLNGDDSPQIRDGYSSEGSVSLHRGGRLGKIDIDSDEFFVVHEIQEGFQTPANALAQMNEYDPIGSDRSLPEAVVKRKPIKKPKRKKTPHVSQEEIRADEDSIDAPRPPSRPRRRSKKNKKKSNLEKQGAVVPYQETIPSDLELPPYGQRLNFPRESLGILGDDEGDDREFEMYENEKMEGKEKPEITVTTPYKEFKVVEREVREQKEMGEIEKEELRAPPRQHRSLKSLTTSENDSLLPENKYDQKCEPINIEDYIIPAQSAQAPPFRPERRPRSNASSLSHVSLPPSSRDTDSILADENYMTDNEPIPSYLVENREKPFYRSNGPRNQEAPSYLSENPQIPCAEEPCVQDIRDYMGYAIVDKSRPPRDPPLPPPRTPPRRRKREVHPDQKFATVPRHVGATPPNNEHPIRPLRNYSTLTQVKSATRKADGEKDNSFYENTIDDDKENNIDNAETVIQYIEIGDDGTRDLVSGDVIQKMKQRPLPAPPRPPRRPRGYRKSLQDITSKENILNESREIRPDKFLIPEETVSTQTEPLPDDFVCEEVNPEPTDAIITPRNEDRVRRELITPTVYSFEETVTHGSLLVQPLDGAKVVPDRQLSRERVIPLSRESDDETSEIPEHFRNLKNPDILDPQSSPANPQHANVVDPKVEKLQVSDLDVDRLRVNELLASKIVVSEIDVSSIRTDEIEGKSGAIRIGDIELPPRLLEEIVRNLSAPPGEVPEPSLREAAERRCEEEKKTLTTQDSDAEPAQISTGATQKASAEPIYPKAISQIQGESKTSAAVTSEESPPDAPPRTPRTTRDSPTQGGDSNTHQEDPRAYRPTALGEMLEPEIDDEPPPRPPQPLEGLYMPSQPPASFYALRAQRYVEGADENIPTAPRRKRHQRSRPVSRSRSTSDESSLSPRAHARSPRAQQRRFSEPSIPDLAGRLVHACGSRVNCSIKRLIYQLTENVLRNADGKQDAHVFMIILLVLIAGLILLGYGDDRTVVHLHHWEFFNPPKDL